MVYTALGSNFDPSHFKNKKSLYELFFNIFFKFQEIIGWRFKTTNQISAYLLKNISKSAISRQLKFWKFLGSKLLRRAVPYVVVLKLVCFNLVQTFMCTLDPAPTGSGYKKVGEKA